jgi:hypothetical protein
MADIGKFNRLQVREADTDGMVLDGQQLGPLQLRRAEVPPGCAPGHEIEVFLALDSNDRVYATMRRPIASVGEFAFLRVVDVATAGAFLDWGMPKDLLLPFREQIRPARVGECELVRIDLDRVSQRLVASARLKRFVAAQPPPNLRPGSPATLLVSERTDLGWKVIVDETYWGLLRTTARVTRGQRVEGFIHHLREDGMVDLGLDAPGYARVPGAAETVLQQLESSANGYLPLHDKSSPQAIRDRLGMSKKVFKQAIGALYKQGRITIEPEGVRKKDA